MDRMAIEKIITEALSLGRKALVEPEAKTIISLASIAVPRHKVVKDVSEALEAARELGFPVVLKIISPDILHKSDVGGVTLDIKNASELQQGWSRMLLGLADEAPVSSIEGFLVEEMVGKGAEVIVGGIRDEQFGPAVMFGLGGVAVELLKDVSFRLAPVTREEAFSMIGEVKSFPLLAGYRGGSYKDLDAIADVIIKVGRIMGEVNGIKELEINPLVVYERGAVAVDARAVLL
ncbi:MAG TPA: acetyl-CoA synthetase [Deltaproteobacteria bacterium]|nr:MAG: acetyl-CoA synthetase [Deltaproteobacteria bacterium GWA2_55_82]OGQ64303.1 MAG: acetyl-CoA synthetase [Deltaproteobacteria bacterium RIFCSPLOWO2_02_FULL_55_12]OIJ74352.1 MAG: acetyl-CoA synthetase [Deltaproteobacteria bacterium GWC2_55_46]HBG46994.1 acetyl-CoA synthetase [Deltaproteobacteria bacterium]HCY10946.1 acetyl-CoA synthetase [Deltaproteobacteria bacterium]